MNQSPWDDNILDCIKAVNRNLHHGGALPMKASEMLYDMECCLCSGDGLYPSSAFRVSSQTVMSKVISILGLNGDTAHDVRGYERIDLERNIYSLERLWFKIKDDPIEL